MRGPSKSYDQYPRRMDSCFFKFLYGMNTSTEILEIVALNVPSAILNLKGTVIQFTVTLTESIQEAQLCSTWMICFP